MAEGKGQGTGEQPQAFAGWQRGLEATEPFFAGEMVVIRAVGLMDVMGSARRRSGRIGRGRDTSRRNCD
jgi:hypothetical protein